MEKKNFTEEMQEKYGPLMKAVDKAAEKLPKRNRRIIDLSEFCSRCRREVNRFLGKLGVQLTPVETTIVNQFASEICSTPSFKMPEVKDVVIRVLSHLTKKVCAMDGIALGFNLVINK